MSTWKDYFTFDKRQRNGVIILLLLIAVVVIARLALPLFFQKGDTDKFNFERQVQLFNSSVEEEQQERSIAESKVIELFDFNPNNLPKEKWKLLGLKDWQIKVIHNYESKGGVFRAKADVKKIYGIKEELYDKLAPHIKIPPSNSTFPAQIASKKDTLFPFNPNNLPEEKWKMLGLKDWQVKIVHNYESKGGSFRSKEDVASIYGIKPEMYEKWKPYISIPEKDTLKFAEESNLLAKVELNTADSTRLVAVRGIGPTYAQRILKYRYRLGGYSEIEQLQEVYGISEDNYPKLAAQLAVDTANMNKININECNWGRLVSHPYISENVANSLINYRKSHGLYKSVNDIQNSDLVNEKLYLKIAAYLKTQ
jgi:competence protein ComEA